LLNSRGGIMAEQLAASAPLLAHCELRLPSVMIESYNVEPEDEEGFIGDRASKRSFRDFVENWRKPLREIGQDPFGKTPSRELSNEKLDAVLLEGEPEGAAVVQGAIEDFAQKLVRVIGCFLQLKSWNDTERVAIGGGLRRTRIGELVVSRAHAILRGRSMLISRRFTTIRIKQGSSERRITPPPGCLRGTTRC
jgi:hypothetical protein